MFQDLGEFLLKGGTLYADIRASEQEAEVQKYQLGAEAAKTVAISKTKILLYGSIALLGVALLLKALD